MRQPFLRGEKQRVQPREAAEGQGARSPLLGFGDRVPNCPVRGNQVADVCALNAEFVCDLHFAP